MNGITALLEWFIVSLIIAGAGMALGLIALCWWWAIGWWRKALYETYLLADMNLWLRRHRAKKGTDL